MIQIPDLNTYKPTRNTQPFQKDYPVFSFAPQYRGQGAFLMQRCNEEGILAKYLYGAVRIYAKKKVVNFYDLIKESVEKHKEHKGLIHKMHKFIENRNCFCVGIKEEDCLYTYERAFERVIVFQFLGDIPLTKNIKSFPTQEEMIEALLLKGVMV
jgi:hypothetical protein